MTKYAIQVKNIRKRFSYSNHNNNSLKRAITQVSKKKDKTLNSFYALDGISFNVEKGDFFGILGRNGSGKSTLLKIISDIYCSSSGSVTHDGKLVSFIELGVGFKGELSGRENVYLNAGLLGFSKTEVDVMYDDIVGFAELEKFMDQKLKNFSSGMKVRLAFSVAIRSEADILVLDEVLAVGDADFKNKCNEYFNTLKDNKKTIILVTHSMKAVRSYCNKAIVIENGKIVFEGNAENAASAYLELFDTETRSTTVNADSQGSGIVTMKNITVEADNKEIDVRLDLTSTEKINGVKFGIAFKNSKKRLVAGVNSLIADGGKELSFLPGETKAIRFTAPNTLGKDEYSITATTVTMSGELLDKQIDVARISNNPSNVYYPTVIPAKVSINNSHKG